MQPSGCVHWEDIPLQNVSDSEGEDESNERDLEEDDIEVTGGGEEDLPSDGTSCEELFRGSQWMGVFEMEPFRYQRVFSQQLKRKADKELAVA